MPRHSFVAYCLPQTSQLYGLVWLLIIVYPLVPDKVFSLAKLLSTNITLEWLLIIVYSLMLDKVFFLCKLLITDITLIWFFMIVDIIL